MVKIFFAYYQLKNFESYNIMREINSPSSNSRDSQSRTQSEVITVQVIPQLLEANQLQSAADLYKLALDLLRRLMV